jgi:hypothetical protein
MSGSDPLQGWWKIVSFHVEAQGSGERMSPYGGNPLGSVVFTGDRMAAILSSSERSDQDAAQFKTTMAYSGSCRVEDGGKLIVKVDAALFPSWIGSEQVRLFEVAGDTLTFTTDWQSMPMFPGRLARSVMTWRRA